MHRNHRLSAQPMLSSFILLVLSCFCMHSAFAQKYVSLNEFLGSTFRSQEVRQYADKASFLKNYNYNLPLINSVDLRTETNEFLLDRQQYTLRVKPNSLKAISYQKKLYQNRISGVTLEKQLRINEGLKKRYLSLIDFYFTQEMIRLEKKHQVVLTDKLEILKHRIYNTDFDIKELVDAEDAITASKLALLKQLQKQNIQSKALRELYGFERDIHINFSDFITPAQIAQEHIGIFNDEPFTIRKQKLILETLENEQKLDIAKSSQFLDFFQAQYGGSNEFVFQEDFSIGIAFNIPFIGNNRQQKGDYYFEKLIEESKLETLQETVKNEQLLLRTQFENAVMNFESINNELKTSSVSSILETYKKIEDIDPKLVLNLKVIQTKKKIESLKSKHTLYTAYIQLLSHQGDLFRQPLRNYLTKEIEFIQI